MATFAPDLKSKLQQNPSATLSLIIRSKDDPHAHAAEIQARGLTVLRTFSLVPALAVRGPASKLLILANEPWVQSIEEDKTVHTM